MSAQPESLPLFRVGPGGEQFHWYRISPETGLPECCYEVLKADGKSYKACTLREARLHNLFPGSSAITGQVDKPQLARWQRKQMARAILDIEPDVLRALIADIGEDKAYDQIYRDSQQQVRDAASSGTDIHAAIEQWYEYGEINPKWAKTISAVREAVHNLTGRDEREGWSSEGTVCSPLGFGGRVDMYNSALGIIVDLKTKDIPEGISPTGWKPRGYDDQARQLAAYRKALPGMRTARCVNLFIARPVVNQAGEFEDQGVVRAYEWDESDLQKAWQEFYCLLRLWQISKDMPTPGMGDV